MHRFPGFGVVFAALLVLSVHSRSATASEVKEGYWDTRFWGDSFDAKPVVDDAGRLILYSSSEIPALFTTKSSILRWDGRRWEPLATNAPKVLTAQWQNGALFTAGYFKMIDAVAALNICRWDENGWSTLGEGLNNEVDAIAFQGTNLIAGGQFTFSGTNLLRHVTRWDGSNWLALGDGIQYPVTAVAASASNVFASWDFRGTNYISKWDGSEWTQIGSFNSSGTVKSMVYYKDSLHVGGSFTNVGATGATNIVKWNEGTWFPVGDVVLSGELTMLSIIQEKLYACGQFSYIRDGITNGAAVVKLDGDRWNSVMGGLFTPATAIAGGNRELFVSGGVTNDAVYGRTAINYPRQAIWEFDGESWSMLNNGPSGTQNITPMVANENKVLSVGSEGHPFIWDGIRFFSTSGAIPDWRLLVNWKGQIFGDGVNGSVALSNSVWAGAAGPPPNGSSAMCVFDGKLIDAGFFVHSWDGKNRKQLGGLFDQSIASIREFNGSLFAAGGFTNIGSVRIPSLAKWTGQTWVEIDGSPNGPVTALAAGDKLYLSGNFSMAGGLTVNKVTAWDGTNWLNFGNGITNGTVTAISVSDDGLLAVGGQFTNLSGGRILGLGIWRNGHWVWPNTDASGEPVVSGLLWRGHDLYVTGAWNHIGGLASLGLAIWHEPGSMLTAREAVSRNEVSIEFTGAMPSIFEIARSADLQSWTPIFTNALGNLTPLAIAPSVGDNAAFYRIQSAGPK